MDWTTILNSVITSVVGLFVAYLGYKQNVKTKEDEEYRKLKDQLEAEREEREQEEKLEQEERLKSIEAKIGTMSDNVNNLADTIETLRDKNIPKIVEQISHLHTMESKNFDYIQSLSNVVVDIAETMTESYAIDDEAKSKIKNTISSHKKSEQDIHTQLIKLIM